jgi:hypothetical protein
MLAGAVLASGSVATMTSAAKAPRGSCRVVAGSKLPTDLNKALCAEVTRAIAEAVPGARFDAEVKVVSSSRLAAKLVLNGHALPQQNFAVMDNRLELDSIRRFARSLGEVAKAAKR